MRSSRPFPLSANWPRKIAIAALSVGCLFFLWEAYLHLRLRTTIIADGKRWIVSPDPQTVENLLKSKNIAVGPQDIVQPPLSSPVPRGGMVRVIRVKEVVEKTTEILPFCILRAERLTRNLRPVELQKGILKKIYREVKVTYHDGTEKERQVIRERETKKTLFRLVLLGKDDGIEEIYDLSRCRKIRMVATAYYPGDPLAWRDGTITRLGLKMQRGIVAVDPKVIRLRTRVYVPGYGYGYAADTGSAIKRKRIDLGVLNAEEEKEWMHRPVDVYILEKAKSW